MATANRRDVQLVVRAKDEAGKAFETAAAALESLLNVNTAVGASATATGSRLQELATIALTIDKAYAKISGSADNAAAAFARQQTAIAEQRAQLASLEGQAAAAAAAIARLNSADAIVDAGRDQTGRIQQLQFLTAQQDRLRVQQDKLRTSIVAQEAALDGQRNSLQQVGSVANAAEAAQAELTRVIEQETLALQRQTAAAEKNARVLRTIEQSTGVTRGDQVLTEENSLLVARERAIATLKAEQDAQVELNRARERGVALARAVMGSESGRSARDSATVFDQAFKQNLEDSEGLLRANAAAEQEMATAAARLRAQIDPLGVIQDRLNKELAEANALYRAGKISATEMAQATALLKANADRAAGSLGQQSAAGGKPTLFGLTPYAVQNLGFQVNDVVTQLASGTSLTQTLAQQGGQIIQIFPRVGASIVAAFSNPVILATVAAVGALVLGLKEAGDQASRLRTLEGALRASGDGAAYQADELYDATEQLDRFGLSAQDALTIVRSFVRDGINPDRIVEFGQAAKDMASVLGIDVAEAATKLGKAFTAGYDAIIELDNATQTLTVAQREHIRTLFEEGRAQEARALAFRLFSESMDEGARKARGPWSQAVTSLGTAWDGFLNALADTSVIRGMIGALDGLGRAASNAFNRINGLTSLEDVQDEINEIEATIARLNRPVQNGTDFFGQNARSITEYTERLQELRAERDRLIAQNADMSETDPLGNSENNAAARRRSERLAQIALENEREGVARLQGQRRIEEAGRLAFEEEMRASGDRIIAQAEREQAIRRETLKVEQEMARQRERQARDAQNSVVQASRLLQQFEGFRSNAYWDVNAFRTGFGSDTVTREDGRIERVTRNTTTTREDATRDLERRIGEFQNVIKEQIGAERFRTFSAQQQAALTSVAYNYGSLPERILEAVRTGTSQEIADAVRGLAGDNGGVNRARRNQEAALLDVPNLAVEANNEARIDDQQQKQDQFLATLDRQLETRGQETEQLRQQQGLQGEALMAVERQQAIEDSLLRARQEAEQAGVDLDSQEFKDRLDLIRQTESAYFDLSRARDAAEQRRSAAEDPVRDLSAQRDALMERIRFYQEQGNFAAADGLQAQLDTVNAALQEAINKALEFWTAIAGSPEQMAALGLTAQQIETIRLRLEASRPAAENLGRQFLMTGQQINQSFAQGAASAFDRFAQAVAEGKDVISSLKDAFLQFASDFLRQIAQMIIQQAIFNLISGGKGGGGGGVGGGIAGFIAGLFHEGGIVGQGGGMRAADPSWFQNARRYHTGGIAGLRPNEVPAILERGEEVLTRGDPRHAMNGGGGGGATNIKNVVVFDPAEVLTKGMASKVGERVILNFIRENKGAVQQALA